MFTRDDTFMFSVDDATQAVYDYTSRKLCLKEPQPKLDAVLLTNLICSRKMTVKLCFFRLAIGNLRIGGVE